MYALGVAFILVLICVVGVGYYYKEDVQGFTKYEVREARSALLEYYRLSNKGDIEGMKRYISPSSGQYYYAEQQVMKNGINPDDCIYFQGNITYSGWDVDGKYFE